MNRSGLPSRRCIIVNDAYFHYSSIESSVPAPDEMSSVDATHAEELIPTLILTHIPVTLNRSLFLSDRLTKMRFRREFC